MLYATQTPNPKRQTPNLNYLYPMSSNLYHYLRQRMPLDERQFADMIPFFTPRKLEKNELLLREGEIPKWGAFVCSGCLRSYVVDDKGKEHVVQFAPENWWLSDMANMISRSPSPYFMDAIETSQVLLIDVPNFQKLRELVPAFADAFQTGIQKHMAAKDERIVASMTIDAETRYQQFLEKYPSIVQRVPLHMLASYLGISPETLSRVRKKQSLRK